MAIHGILDGFKKATAGLSLYEFSFIAQRRGGAFYVKRTHLDVPVPRSVVFLFLVFELRLHLLRVIIPVLEDTVDAASEGIVLLN